MTTMVSAGHVAAGGGVTRDRLRVPWGTVLPLAVVAALGSTFWVVAVRGAVGAIERTSDPFPAWLRESTLLLPLYVFAVLGALTLALRWFGRSGRRTRSTAATFLLVVAAVSIVGAVVLTANAVYDYQLQATHLDAMNATHGPCSAECVTSQLHDGYVLQVRAVVFGSLMILASNLVLLGLLVGLRGGRLELASSRREPARVGRFDNVELFLVTGLLGAAVIHATAVPEQLSRWPAAGIALLLLTVAEADAALLFLLRLRSAQFVATAVVSAGPLLVWLYSRTAGLPFGPAAGSPEPVGLTDAAVAVLEVATLAVAVVALTSRRPVRPSRSQHSARLALAGVVAATAVGLAGGAVAAATGQPSHSEHSGHNGPPTVVVGSTVD
jgi:hypothetical protein